MDMTMISILAVATVINFISIQIKIRKGDGTNAVVDVLVFGVMAYLFFGTLGGMIIAVVASAFFSLWLLVVPFEFKMPEGSGFDMSKFGIDMDAINAAMEEQPKKHKKHKKKKHAAAA